MAQATVKTVQYLDPRIEPQPDPVYDYVIGPTQNQYYRIPASGFSQSNITFNNLTTLGVDRAYLDTFEIELNADITFELNANADADKIVPGLDEWTFQSFPFNTCCTEARVNINGGAFFSQPQSYVRMKERYMNQYELAKSYQNICPCHRPELQYESGRRYDVTCSLYDTHQLMSKDGGNVASRYGAMQGGYMPSTAGYIGGSNMSILECSGNRNPDYPATAIRRGDDGTGKRLLVSSITWREPLFVSPFSSRYDATYGRPLYNITSMDLAFTLNNLGNMIRLANLHSQNTSSGGAQPTVVPPTHNVTSYTVKLNSAVLCYQVMTIPPILNKPLTTLVPYRRFVPYVTEYTRTSQNANQRTGTAVDPGGSEISLTSGVYTFNEIPTAIWVAVAPVKDRYQTNEGDKYTPPQGAALPFSNINGYAGNWDSNKLFGFIKKVDISMANTTQILATAKPLDLYRIAKANGCEDSAESWLNVQTPMFQPKSVGAANALLVSGANIIYKNNAYVPVANLSVKPQGAGSVLRLKPGVDIVVPDQPLIPGANANNMVFQITVDAKTPYNSGEQLYYGLWLLFEYVGVAAISPGQCEITMNPLGTGDIMAVSPVMSATSESTEGSLEGSGFWDSVKKKTRIAGQLADDGIISMILKRIPGASGAADWAKKHGLGEPACKRSRGGVMNGGAVIGKGLNDWV